MSDIAVIILIGKERVHLARCVEKLAALSPRQIFLVESQPDDGGVAIAKETAAKFGLRLETKYNKWPGTQTIQFNWALDNLPIEAEWILRLDADEYLTLDTIDELKTFLSPTPTQNSNSSDAVAGLTLELRRRFCGGEIRHATNGIRQVRLFRRGKGRYPETLMDERLEIDGDVIDFDGAFFDDNLNSMDWWREKHRGYAKREAAQAIESMRTGVWTDPRKASYYKLPRYFRAFAYFCIRYFVKGGFLDGYPGWMWNFWQGLWYRCLVDYEIGKLRKR